LTQNVGKDLFLSFLSIGTIIDCFSAAQIWQFHYEFLD